MDLSHLTHSADPSSVGSPPALQQRGTLRTSDENQRKRRAVDFDPPGWSTGSPEGQQSPMSRFSNTRSFEDVQVITKKFNESHGEYLPMILSRLAKIERELDMRRSPAGSSNAQHNPDMASMRSIPFLVMKGNLDPSLNSHFTASDGRTLAHNDQHRQPDASFTDALSLRRDLNSPENPTFGVWQTSTIEEILTWPILNFTGDLNGGIDVLMESSDEEDGDDEDDESQIVNESFLRRKSDWSKSSRVKRGLDNSMMVAQFIESFLRNVHVKNPILDVSQLRSYAANLIENGLAFDGETCQVLLVCALGAISSPWDTSQLDIFPRPIPSSERFHIAQQYFDAAQKRLGGLWTHSSLISAQCLYLTGLFFMYCQKSIAGWRAFNSANTACRSYISKRKAQQKKSVPRPDCRSLEERLCWSCFKSEREIACQIGLETSGLTLFANSASLPTPPNGHASDINQPLSNAAQNMTPAPSPNLNVLDEAFEDQSWSYSLREIMLSKLEMRINIYSQDKWREDYSRVKEQPEPFFQSVVETLRGLDDELTNYYKTLPPILKLSLSDLTPCSDELRNNLRWRLLGVKHDITGPALFVLLHHNVSRWQRRLVAELVEMANACIKLNINLLGIAITSHRSQTTWLAIRIGVRSALILIAANKLAAQHLPSLDSLYVPDRAAMSDGFRALVKGLKYWSAESKDCMTYMDVLQRLDPVFQTLAQRI